MDPSIGRPLRRARSWRVPAAAVTLALAVGLATAPVAGAVTLTNAWQAKIGTAGANGTAKISAFTTGTGSVVLKLAKLKPATLYSVTLLKGSCSGGTLLTLASIKTTSAGAAARTTSLTVTQVNAIKAATSGTKKIAIRLKYLTAVKCGLFTVLPVPAYVAANIPVGPYPEGVAITPTGVWVADYYHGKLTRIDPVTNALLSSLQLGSETDVIAPRAFVFLEGSFWVAVDEYDATAQNKTGVSVRRIDATTGQSVATVKVGSDIVDIAASPGAVWVTNYDDGTLSRIDSATNQVVATVNSGKGTSGVAFGEGSVWVTNETTDSVLRIDPATNQIVATIPTIGLPEGIVDGGGAIWVANWGTTGEPDGVVSRIDPATNLVTGTVPVGTNPLWITYGGGSVWVAMDGEPAVARITAATNAVARIRAGAAVTDKDGNVVGLWRIAASDHAVWVDQSLPRVDETSPPTPGILVRINF